MRDTMSRVIVAEYDARENALGLAEPLPDVKDHEKVRISIEKQDDSRQSSPAVDPLGRLASLDAPTADIGVMLAEVESGRQ